MHHNTVVLDTQYSTLERGLVFVVSESKNHLLDEAGKRAYFNVEDTLTYEGNDYEILNIEAEGWNATNKELAVKLKVKKMTKTNGGAWSPTESSHIYWLLRYGVEAEDLVAILTAPNGLLNRRTEASVKKQTSNILKFVSLEDGKEVANKPTEVQIDHYRKAAKVLAHSSLIQYHPADSSDVKIRYSINKKRRTQKELTDDERFEQLDVNQIPVDTRALGEALREQREYQTPVAVKTTAAENAPTDHGASILSGSIKVSDLDEKSESLIAKINAIVKKLPKGEASVMLLAKALGVKKFKTVHNVNVVEIEF